MNKQDLIHAISLSSGLTQKDAARALDGFTDAVTNSLKAGDSVALIGFGTFSVKERAARTGRNPQTGATLEIKASKVPSFKAGKGLKDSVA